MSDNYVYLFSSWSSSFINGVKEGGKEGGKEGVHFFPHKILAFTFCKPITVSGNVWRGRNTWNERPPSSAANFSVQFSHSIFVCSFLQNLQMIKLTIAEVANSVSDYNFVVQILATQRRAEVKKILNWQFEQRSHACIIPPKGGRRLAITLYKLWPTACNNIYLLFLLSLSLRVARPIKAGKLYFLYKHGAMTPENHKVLQMITFLLLETIQLAKP